ncbi:MAG: LacI family DNA-binding transcriptional regulator [Hespellia sp.]|nr:LacI family DNA-binding transcriptional regulator [Hespellia sp.]
MTINEIAELAGVSRATVSRYLNHGYISEEKAERVKKVIAQTGYVPSTQAQQLRTKKTCLIGVILPKINSESISRIVAGISLVLSERGYHLLLANTDNDEKKELEYLQLFQDNRVDGIILVGTIFTKEHEKLMKELPIPIVVVGQHVEGYVSIYHDDLGAAEAVTDQMVAAGGKNFGMIGATSRDVAVGQERRDGFLKSLKKAGIKVEKDGIREAAFTSESGYLMAKDLMEKNPQIDSLFCATDSMAVGAMEYLKERGKKIPQDVQLMGFGDSKLGKVAEPKLTTVHLSYKTSGEDAAKIILELLDHKNETVRELKLGYRIVEGGTLRTSLV